jgi:hypothetical protein
VGSLKKSLNATFISKVLTNKLKSVLKKIIFKSQNEFIRGETDLLFGYCS